MPIYHVTHRSIEITVYEVEAANEEDAEDAWNNGHHGTLVRTWQDGEMDVEAVT